MGVDPCDEHPVLPTLYSSKGPRTSHSLTPSLGLSVVRVWNCRSHYLILRQVVRPWSWARGPLICCQGSE